MSNAFAVRRNEDRMAMQLAVYVSGHQQHPGVETSLTEDISPHGARVRTKREWRADEHLVLAALRGSFQSLARVAYCKSREGEEGFVVGVEFVRPEGHWTRK